MIVLNQLELQEIRGGSTNWLWIGGIFGGLFTFLAGFIDGFLNNNTSCSKEG